MTILVALLAVAHVLAGAAWFGAMFYSLTVLQPRAIVFFQHDETFEAFITAVSHGARWKVLGAFGFLALTGFGLMALKWQPASTLWLVLIGAKAVLWLVALGLFVHISWRLWPARVFATPQEIPSFQRTFRRLGRIMLLLVGLDLALGVLAHTLGQSSAGP